MKTETIRIPKMNGGNDRLKFILIGIAIGIVIGTVLLYLLMNFGIIKPYNLFRSSMNRDFTGFPGNENFSRNGTFQGPPR